MVPDRGHAEKAGGLAHIQLVMQPVMQRRLDDMAADPAETRLDARMNDEAQHDGDDIDPDHRLRRGAQQRHGNIDEKDAGKSGGMNAHRIDHAEILRRMMIAVQRPEQARMTQAVRPIIEEGIGIEMDQHLDRQRQEGRIDGKAGFGRQGIAQGNAGQDRQAQHHDPPDQPHDMGLVEDEEGHVSLHRGGGRQEGARGAFFPPDHGAFQPQHAGQDQQHQRGIAQELVVDILESENMPGQAHYETVGKQGGKGPPGGANQEQVGDEPRNNQPARHGARHAHGASRFGVVQSDSHETRNPG